MSETAVTLESLTTAFRAVDGQLDALLQRYTDTPDEKIPVDDRKEISRLNAEAAKIQGDINEATFEGGVAGISQQRAVRQQQLANTAGRVFSYGAGGGQQGHSQAVQQAQAAAAKTLGDRFVGEVLTPYLERYAPNGRTVPTDRMPDSDALQFAASMKSLVHSPLGSLPSLQAAAKALITGSYDLTNASTSAGVYTRPFMDTQVELPRRELMLRDLVKEMTTDSDVIWYPKFISRTNNAAVVAEATSESDSSGLKPKSIFDLEVASETVKTIANWMPISRKALRNAPLIRQTVDDELRANVEEALEDEMIGGDGTGEHFLGIENLPDVTDVAFAGDIKTTLRKMLTAARKTPAYILSVREPVNRRAIALLLHPDDVEEYDLDQDAELRYYTGGPVTLMAPYAWGVPIVQSEAVTAGTAWMADWSVFTLYDREQTTVRMSDSHADFFARNLIAVLAEGVWAFTCKRQSAVIKAPLS